MLPFVNAIVALSHCIYLMQAYIILYWTIATAEHSVLEVG
jgi:hypothetical protein